MNKLKVGVKFGVKYWDNNFPGAYAVITKIEPDIWIDNFLVTASIHYDGKNELQTISMNKNFLNNNSECYIIEDKIVSHLPDFL